MTLPKITTPTYELELPSTDKKVKFRPFLVKEEKILLIAIENDKSEEMLSAIKQIIKNCTFDKIDVEKIPLFDTAIVTLSYFFIKFTISPSSGNLSNSNLLNTNTSSTITSNAPRSPGMCPAITSGNAKPNSSLKLRALGS
mgnify:CR=1 FL=1